MVLCLFDELTNLFLYQQLGEGESRYICRRSVKQSTRGYSAEHSHSLSFTGKAGPMTMQKIVLTVHA